MSTGVARVGAGDLRGAAAHQAEEDDMSEPTGSRGSGQDEDAGSHASVGDAVERPGGGRTDAENDVDEAMGASDEQ